MKLKNVVSILRYSRTWIIRTFSIRILDYLDGFRKIIFSFTSMNVCMNVCVHVGKAYKQKNNLTLYTVYIYIYIIMCLKICLQTFNHDVHMYNIIIYLIIYFIFTQKVFNTQIYLKKVFEFFFWRIITW